MAAEDEAAMGGAFRGHHPVRRAFRHGAEDAGDDQRVGFGVAAHFRARIVDIHHRAGRRNDADRAEAAGVFRDRLVGQVQHGVVGGRPGDAEGSVDRALGLRRGAGVIDHHLVALHIDGDADPIFLGLDAVILEAILEGVAAIGERGDFGPHARFRIIHQVADGLAEDILAVFLDQLDHALLAHVDGAN